MTIFQQPINQTIITTVRPDGTFSTVSCPEMQFPNPTAGNFIFLMITAMVAIFILLGSEGSLESSDDYYNEPTQYLEHVTSSPYEYFEEAEADLNQDSEPSLLRMMFPTSGSSETASAASKQHAKKSDEKADNFHAGRIFTKSFKKRLTREDIEKALEKHSDLSRKQFVRRAKNEILAAAGYNFENKPNVYNYYMKYDWYQDLDKTDSIHLSKAARANIDLLEEYI